VLEVIAHDEEASGDFELVPVTGKALSPRNATRHGITSDAILPGEAHAFYAHARGIFDSFQPVGQAESFLVARVAMLMWRLHRVAAYESEEISQALKHSTAHLLRQLEQLNTAISLELEALRSDADPEYREQARQYVEQVRQERDSMLEQLGSLQRLALLPEAVVRKVPRYEATLSKALSLAINDLRRLQADRKQR
jgi:glutamate-1-semialdehyde aminotransferase